MVSEARSHCAIAKKYAREVATEKRIAGDYTRYACERFLKDLKRKDILFDEVAASRACRFIEKQLHIKGEWAQRHEYLTLAPWQVWIVVSIFGFKRLDGSRRFDEAYVRVGRKNGKSVLAAAIGLYMMVADDEFGAEVYAGATSEKQAWEVFGPARLMAQRHPEFAQHFGVDVHSRSLTCVSDNSKFQPVIGNPGDGASPHAAIIDEFHEHITWSQYYTFKTGMGARKQPLLLIITTAGDNIASPCFEKDDEVRRVLDGTSKADNVFGVIYAADDGDDWTSVTALKKANPNLGISVNRRFLDAQLEAAKRGGSAEAAYKTKHLNLWVAAGSAFLPSLAWAHCGDSQLRLEDFIGKPCIFGVDLASRIDIVALVRLFFEPGDDGNLIYTAFPRFWLPEETVAEDKSGTYTRFLRAGDLETHPEEEIDFAKLRQSLKEEAKLYTPLEIAFDPWRAIGIEQELTAEGFVMVRIPQTIAMFTDPMNELEAAVLSGRFRHPNNECFNWMSRNLVAKEDTNGNKKPRREIPKNKIDGMVAALMAMNRALAHRPKRFTMLFV